MDNQQALDLLKSVIQVNTVLGNEQVLADKLESLLQNYGFETESVEYDEGRYQLVATYNEDDDGPVLAFSGHLDVVPIGEAEWEEGSFEAVEKDGKIYGRGTSDMKSGLVSAIVALIRLKETDQSINGTIKLIITVGEETSSVGAEQLVNEGYADDVDAMIINEPTNLNIGIAHKGALWPRITTYGKTAHGAMPENGVNAVNHLVKVINKINQDERFFFEQFEDEEVGQSTKSLNIFHGGSGTNVVPDQARLEFDIRTLVSQNHDKIKSDFKNLLEEIKEEDESFEYNLEFINDLVAIKTEKKNPFVHVVADAFESTLRKDAEIVNPSYYTDGSKFFLVEKDFPIVIIGPGLPELAHQPNEYVEIKKFYDMIDINQKVAEIYLG